MAKGRMFTKGHFASDMLEGVRFAGYADGETWNGWACPFFSYNTACDILSASEHYGYAWRFDSQSDTFIVSHQEDPADFAPEQFKGIEATVEGQALTVYAIGAYSWCWRAL